MEYLSTRVGPYLIAAQCLSYIYFETNVKSNGKLEVLMLTSLVVIVNFAFPIFYI